MFCDSKALPITCVEQATRPFYDNDVAAPGAPEGVSLVTRKYSRRSLGMLLPALAANRLSAQESSKRLPSRAFRFEDLPTKMAETGKSHAVLEGETHSAIPVEVHVTELAAGGSPHPPHQHAHEEMFLMQAGIMDATVNGKTTRLTPGSVCYVNSNDLHGVRNPGPDRAEYFVVALGAKS
jgi:mannose-6-phosphate isomerase-like protein (cupin superfamily)